VKACFRDSPYDTPYDSPPPGQSGHYKTVNKGVPRGHSAAVDGQKPKRHKVLLLTNPGPPSQVGGLGEVIVVFSPDQTPPPAKTPEAGKGRTEGGSEAGTVDVLVNHLDGTLERGMGAE
jgi:hypothetical protein